MRPFAPLLGVLLLAACVVDGRPEEEQDEIVRAAQSALAAFHAPSFSFGISRGGSPWLLRGFSSDRATADADTVFAIASCTKAFTSAALARVSELDNGDDLYSVGNFWNSRVDGLLPVDLESECASSLLSPLDMVTHRTGMPGYDSLWYDTEGYTSEEVFAKLRYLPSWGTGAFRAQFHYNNIMVSSAGELVLPAAWLRLRQSKTTWETFVREHITQPLGMRRTDFSITQLPKDNVALPFRLAPGTTKVEPVPRKNVDNIQAAGGINSCARDMLNWTMMHVDGGSFGGKRILSEQQVSFLHTPHMHMPHNESFNSWFPFLRSMGYGGGWAISSYRGHTVVLHPGNIDGFSSLAVLLPDDGISLVLLVNLDSTYLPFSVAWSAIDILLFGAQTRDWQKFYVDKAAREAQEQSREWNAVVRERRNDTHPSHADLNAYAGRYSDPAFGSYEITSTPKELTLSYFGEKSTLVHWQYDTFAVIGFESAQFFTFSNDPATGRVKSLSVAVGGPDLRAFQKR
jgi:CubicO group peptidase (beta-lactamase class C family)